MLQHGAVKHVYSAIDDSRSGDSQLFPKANDSIVQIQLNGSVSGRVWNPARRHADQSAMFPVKANEFTKIQFQKRVAIQYQKFRSLRKMAFREFHRACRLERGRFLRVDDLNARFLAVAEFFFDLIGEMARAHDQAADALGLQLPDQQLQE